MVDLNVGYVVIGFYGIFAVICAAIGNYWDKKNGFSNGYVVGNILSLIFWFTVGRAAARA